VSVSLKNQVESDDMRFPGDRASTNDTEPLRRYSPTETDTFTYCPRPRKFAFRNADLTYDARKSSSRLK